MKFLKDFLVAYLYLYFFCNCFCISFVFVFVFAFVFVSVFVFIFSTCVFVCINLITETRQEEGRLGDSTSFSTGFELVFVEPYW